MRKKNLTPEQILLNNRVPIDRVKGFYFMANNTTFRGLPILTLLLNNGDRKKICLNKADVSQMLHYLMGNNCTFLNHYTNIPVNEPSIENCSYRSVLNDAYFIALSCVMFAVVIVSLLSIRDYESAMQRISLCLLAIGSGLLVLKLLHQPYVKIIDNVLYINNRPDKPKIDLVDVMKVTVSPYGKGEVLEVLTKECNYYSFTLNGGKTKLLINDLRQLGIDASYGYCVLND